MISGAKEPGNSDVQCLGGVLGEDHMVRLGTAEKLRQAAAKAVDPPGGGEGLLMGPPSAVAPGIHGLQNRPGYPGGLGAGGGGVIQVDQGFTTFPAPASFSTMVYILVTVPTRSFSVRP